MSISSTVRKVGPFVGNGVTTSFPFAFKVFQTSDIEAISADSAGTESTLVLNTDYSVSLNADQDNNPGGSVTLTAALATGRTLIISSAVPETQGTVLTNLGGFYPTVINDAHDKLTILIQQQNEQLARSLRFPITESALSATLPPVASRKGLLLGFDPTTGAPVAVASTLSADAGPFVGNVTGDITSRGASSFKKLNGLRFLEGYGAACDGVTNDDVALAAAIADVVATSSILVIPAGKTCVFSSAIAITSGNFGIVGGPGAKLKYTGTGIALSIDGTAITNGAQSILLRDFAIDAPNGTNCAYFTKVTRSLISNIEGRGCSGIAFVFDFGVSDTIENIVVSSNNGAFSHTPTGGIKVTGSSNLTFIGEKIEGVNGDGVLVEKSSLTSFFGGTSEGNTGRGYYVTAPTGSSLGTTFIATDAESNGGNDYELSGTNVRSTRFLNINGQGSLVTGVSRETIIDGGGFGSITIGAGSAAMLINGVRYGSLTDSGTNTQIFGLNAAVPNSLAATDFNGTAQFKASPLLPNNIPLQAKTSTGGLLNLLWPTAADQTILTYLATKAFKVNDNNGNTRLQVNDSGAVVTGTLAATGELDLNTKPWVSTTAPTIGSGFGTSPSVTANNGTAVIIVNVGTGGAASSGVITMPTISGVTGWVAHVQNLTAQAGHRADNTVQTASSATSITIENQTKSTGAAVAWTASDVVRIIAFAY